MSEESNEPRFFGPCLVAPLVLRAQQPEPAAWVPPRDWNPKTAGWDPRITYQGLSEEEKESLTEEFLLFEIPGNEDDDPDDPLVQKSKGHVLLAKLPTLFRSMGRTNKARNAMCIEQCRSKSVPHPASGATCLHVTEFLKVMDDELKQDATELAQSDADGLTQRLRDAERDWEATNTPLVAQAAAEAAARNHWTNTVAARARWYGRVDAKSPKDVGHAAKMAAARRAAASNNPAAIEQLLALDRLASGEHNAAAAAAARQGAAAAEAAHAAGAPPSMAQAEGAEVERGVALDPVLLRNVASGGDGEEVSSLHQLALSRHPRERGRVPGASPDATASSAPGDAAAALSSDPRADFVPAAAAKHHQVPPWQRPHPLPTSRATAVVVRADRASAYAPYLPPPDFWEDRQSAGLQAKAKAAAHEAKMAKRAAAATTAAAATAASDGSSGGDGARHLSPAAAGGGEQEEEEEKEEEKGSENSPRTKVAAVEVAGPVRLEVGAEAKGRWPIMTKAEERLRASKAASFAARKEAARVANNNKALEEDEGKGNEQGAVDKHPIGMNNTTSNSAGVMNNNDDDDDDLDDVDRAEQLAAAQAQEVAAARQAEDEEARAEAERRKWKTLSPEQRLEITETKALAEAQKRAAAQLNEMRQAQDERAWEVMRQRSKVAALNKAVLSGRLQHNLMRLNLRVPGWPDPQELKDLQKEAQKNELKNEKKKEKQEKRRKKKEQEKDPDSGLDEDFNLTDDDNDDDEDDDDESNETSSTYTARSLSSMTSNTIAQKVAHREERARAAALAAELATAAAAEEEAQRLREREAALEWLKHTDLHTANVAEILLETEVDRMLEAAISEAAAERFEARLARPPPKHNPPVWTSKQHLRELGPVHCMALGPGVPLSPNIEGNDDDYDDDDDDNCGRDYQEGVDDEVGNGNGEEMENVDKERVQEECGEKEELKRRKSIHESRRRCRDENAAWAIADLLAVGRDDEGVSVWNLAGSAEEEASAGDAGGERRARGKKQGSSKAKSNVSESSSSSSSTKGVRIASWVTHHGPARTPTPFVAWLPGLPADYTSSAPSINTNRDGAPVRNNTSAAAAAAATPETNLESKTDDTPTANTGATTIAAASTIMPAAVTSTNLPAAAAAAAAALRRVARRPALCCGSGDGRMRIYSPLAPGELALNDPAAQDLLHAKGLSKGPRNARVEPYMWTPGVGHGLMSSNQAVKAGSGTTATTISTTNRSGGEAAGTSRRRGPLGPHGWALVQTVRVHRTPVTCGALSLDNQWLATGSAGGLTRSDRMAGATPLLRVWQVLPRDVAYEESWLRRQKSVQAASAAADRSNNARRAISDQPRVRVDPITGAVDVWWPPPSSSSDTADAADTDTAAADTAPPSAGVSTTEGAATTDDPREATFTGESNDQEAGDDASGPESNRSSSSSCDVVACMGVDGKACVAEGIGHAEALTCILWLPCPVDEHSDEVDMNANADGVTPPQQPSEQKGKLYHIVTGSRDGELRQWCVRLGGPPRRPASRVSTPLAANSREVFPLALTDAICVRVLRAPCVDTATSNSKSKNNDNSSDQDGSSSSRALQGFDRTPAAILSLELLDESASSEPTPIGSSCTYSNDDTRSLSIGQRDKKSALTDGDKVSDGNNRPRSTVRVVVGDGLGRVRVWTLRLPRDRQKKQVLPTPESNVEDTDESSFDSSDNTGNNNDDEQSEHGEGQFPSDFEDPAAEEARWREDACWGVGRDATLAELTEAAADQEAAAPASNGGAAITATAARACALSAEKLARDAEARRGAGTPWEVANYAPCSIKAAVPLLNPLDQSNRRQLRPYRQALTAKATTESATPPPPEPLLPSLLMGLSVPFQSSLLNLSTLQGAPLLYPLVRAGLSEADAMLAAVRKVEAAKAALVEAKDGDDVPREDFDVLADGQREAANLDGADGKAQDEGEGAHVRRSSIDSAENNTLASSISSSASTAEDENNSAALSGAGPVTTMTRTPVEGADWSPMGFWLTKPAPVLREPKPPAPEVEEAARAALAAAAAAAAGATKTATSAAAAGSQGQHAGELNDSKVDSQQPPLEKEVAYHSTAWLGAHDGGLVCVEGEATLSYALRQREAYYYRPHGRLQLPKKPPRLITGGADWAIHVWAPERPRLVTEPNPAGEKP